jgi:hypothetical protein
MDRDPKFTLVLAIKSRGGGRWSDDDYDVRHGEGSARSPSLSTPFPAADSSPWPEGLGSPTPWRANRLKLNSPCTAGKSCSVPDLNQLSGCLLAVCLVTTTVGEAYHSLRHFPVGPVLLSPKSVAKRAELARRGSRSLYIAVGASWPDCSLRPIFLRDSVLPSKSTDFWEPIFSACLRTSAPDKFESLSLDREQLCTNRSC